MPPSPLAGGAEEGAEPGPFRFWQAAPEEEEVEEVEGEGAVEDCLGHHQGATPSVLPTLAPPPLSPPFSAAGAPCLSSNHPCPIANHPFLFSRGQDMSFVRTTSSCHRSTPLRIHGQSTPWQMNHELWRMPMPVHLMCLFEIRGRSACTWLS